VLRRIFILKRYEIIESWRKLHNEELHNLFSFAKYNYTDQIIMASFCVFSIYIHFRKIVLTEINTV
jgi:hypothetical protein